MIVLYEKRIAVRIGKLAIEQYESYRYRFILDDNNEIEPISYWIIPGTVSLTED